MPRKWKCWSFSGVHLLVTPWTVAHKPLLSMEFSRQEYWDGLPFPSLGDLSNPGLLHCRRILYHVSHQGSPVMLRDWQNQSVQTLHVSPHPSVVHFNKCPTCKSRPVKRIFPLPGKQVWTSERLVVSLPPPPSSGQRSSLWVWVTVSPVL